MKRLASTLIIAMLTIGYFAPVRAEENKELKTSEQKLKTYQLQASLQTVETALIEEYLFQSKKDGQKSESTIKILNENDQIVYKGDSIDAQDLLKTSSYLFSAENTDFYIIQ